MAADTGAARQEGTIMSDPVLLKEVIAIPERAGAEDYVLRLTDGIERDHIAETVAEYVVTDDLADAFERALDLVAASVRDGTSRAAFLSGSFGSGKSHFMAVLYALLGHNPAARARPELAPVIARHDGILQDRKILRLAFHFLDADSIEACILGGYVAQIRQLHPEAPLPAVHLTDALFRDADAMRERVGDDTLFAGLSASGESGASGPWAAVLGGQTWTPASYDAARAAAPDSTQRATLASALVRTYFTAYTSVADFVDLDTGLAAISSHAKTLGYDAIVMFLDELVLWLAFRVRDAQFFGREAQKITKLVEANHTRPIPLVSFVARQLDLRRYFVESGSGVGAEHDALDAAFRHQEGRFATIVLGDDNLPYVAQQRLLKPVSPAARDILDAAFARLDRTPAVWDVLLDGVGTQGGSRGADQAAFRRTYPFSPALVSTLRTLASAMQRDRTALKVMQQLLVDQRDHLTVDDVIPVGDTFDLVVQGNQAVTAEMQGRFRNAKQLYDTKLRPLLLREHGLSEAAARDLPPRHPFRADDRLVKTLVLSAVAPDVPALAELTPGRLAALNHGSIVSPLPGQEASTVLAKLRRWHAEVPEIHIGSDPINPVIRLRVSEVDYESVVEKARGEDTEGRRRQLMKALVWEAFGFTDTGDDLAGVNRQTRIWRGSRREIELVFGNVRDRAWFADEQFRAGPGTWRFVVDYPFDEEGRSVREDDARVAALTASGLVTNTIVWLPHFISPDRRADLGRLAVLGWVLGSAERWESMSSHLAVADRAQARIILENQRDALRARLRRVVQEAYGAAAHTPGNLDIEEGHEHVLSCLNPEVNPRSPVGADLAAALSNLLDQVFTASYPEHPRFEPGDEEVRTADLGKVLEVVEAARQDEGGRVFVEPARRDAVRRVANPLGVGHMGETHFVFNGTTFPWATRFARPMGAAGIDPTDAVTVGTVRGWITGLTPAYGLRPEVADLVIAAWASHTGRTWYRYGAQLTPAPRLGQVADDIELRPEALPTREVYERALERAATLLGVGGSRFLTGTSAAELASSIRAALAPLAGPARALVGLLDRAHEHLATVPAATGRHATAVACAHLAAAVAATQDAIAVLEAVAAAPLPGTEQAAGRSLSSAAAVGAALAGFQWERLTQLLEAEHADTERGAQARAALQRLRAALAADELAQPLAPALTQADDDVFSWLSTATAPTVASPAPAEPASPAPSAGGRVRRVVRTAADAANVQDELARFLAEHTGEEVRVEWRAGP